MSLFSAVLFLFSVINLFSMGFELNLAEYGKHNVYEIIWKLGLITLEIANRNTI